MGFSTDTSTGKEMTEGGNYLAEPGTYHCSIVSAESPPTDKDGKLIDGGIVKVEFSVLAGGPQDKSGAFVGKGKSIQMIFFQPKMTSKDQGKMARKKLTALLIAVGEVTEATAGGNVDADESQWEGRQVVMTLEHREGGDGKKYLDLNFDDIFHVDHPDVATAAKDEAALKLIPAAARRTKYAAEIDAVKGSKNSNNGSSGNGNGQQAQPAGIPADDDDDLGL